MKRKTIPQLKRTLDKVFSKYIRLRDALITTGTKTYARCITCKERKDIRYMDAGHFVGRGAGATRYDERNVHAQCKKCNMGGRPTMHQDYEREMIKLYGKETVDEIIKLGKQPYHFNREWLEDQIKYYKNEYKEIKENN